MCVQRYRDPRPWSTNWYDTPRGANPTAASSAKKKCWFCLKTKGDPHHDTSNIFEWVAAKKSPLSLSREHRENQRELGTARGQSSPATTPSSQSQFLRCSTWWREELRSRSRSWDLCRTLVALRDPTSEGVVTHVSHRVIWVYVD